MSKQKRLVAITISLFILIILAVILSTTNLKLTPKQSSIRVNRQAHNQNNTEYKQKFLGKGRDISNSFTKKILLDIPYSAKEEGLGFLDLTCDGFERPKAPETIDIAKNGNVYIDDPANGRLGKFRVQDANTELNVKTASSVIKVYSQNGKYLRKITPPKRWTRNFGLDSQENLYALEPTKVYKRSSKKDSYELVVSGLHGANRLQVVPSGDFCVESEGGSEQWREVLLQRYSKRGNLLRTYVGYGDLGALAYEGERGYKVYRLGLGGRPKGKRYLIDRSVHQKKDLVFECYSQDGYVDMYGTVIGIDANSDMYFVRTIWPDVIINNVELELTERLSKLETWIDIINLKLGEMSSVRIEPDKSLPTNAPANQRFKIDDQGNIYQLQTDKHGAKVLKYMRK